MARIAKGKVGRRRFRRPTFLLAVGLTLSVGVAVAGAEMMTKTEPSHDRKRMTNAPGMRTVDPLTLQVASPSQTVAPGDSATYALRVQLGPRRSRGLSGRTRLSVGTGIPRGASASFSPEATVVPGGDSRLPSTLTITTRPGTATGTYRFRIRARRPHGRGHATVRLIVSSPATPPPAPSAPAAPTTPSPIAPAPSPPVLTAPDAFTISGNLPDLLIPGSEGSLDLSLANHEDADLSISALTVRVAAVSAPRADAQHPCSPADFSVTQFSGATGFTLPASTTATLGELGFDAAQWPRVTMLDSASDQNGCRTATFQLAFAGTAVEMTP